MQSVKVEGIPPSTMIADLKAQVVEIENILMDEQAAREKGLAGTDVTLNALLPKAGVQAATGVTRARPLHSTSGASKRSNPIPSSLASSQVRLQHIWSPDC